MKYSVQDIEDMRRMTADLICLEQGYEDPDFVNPRHTEIRLQTYLQQGVSYSEMVAYHRGATDRYKQAV